MLDNRASLSAFSEYGSDYVILTGAFSSAVTERLIQRLSDHHLNLVVEGTGRTVDVPKRTAELLTGKGYAVELGVIAARRCRCAAPCFGFIR